mgnify:CR=1 FL=1
MLRSHQKATPLGTKSWNFSKTLQNHPKVDISGSEDRFRLMFESAAPRGHERSSGRAEPSQNYICKPLETNLDNLKSTGAGPIFRQYFKVAKLPSAIRTRPPGRPPSKLGVVPPAPTWQCMIVPWQHDCTKILPYGKPLCGPPTPLWTQKQAPPKSVFR